MSNEQMSLSDVLSDAPPPAAPAEAPPKAEAPPPAPPAEAAPAEPAEPPVETVKSKRKAFQQRERDAQDEGAGKVRGPDGKFVAKEAAPVAEPAAPAAEKPVEAKPAEPAPPAAPVPAVPPQQEMTDKEKALLRAAQDERDKRQVLERRLAALEKPQEEPKAFWDDPEGAIKTFEKKIEETVVNTRFNTAEAIARSKYSDFEEKLGVFGQLLQQIPGLNQQWVAAPDPAEFAYRLAKNHIDIQQVGSIDALRKKIEEETSAKVRAEVEAEYKKKAEDAEKIRAALPGSLSNARGVGITTPVWNGPTSLEDILKR